MLVSADGCVESVSGAITRQLGHDPEFIEGQPLSRLVPEAHREDLEGAFERASRGASVAGPVTVTIPLIRHGNKETLPFELSLVNLVDDPTVGGYVVTGHDITERRTADLELRTALSLLKATLDSTADGILVVGTDGRVVKLNQRLAEMWQVPESVLEGADRPGAHRLQYRDQLSSPAEFVAKVEQVYEVDGTESSDVLEFKDGRVFERVSKPQTVDGTIVGRVWSFRDITDRKRLEERLSFQAFHDSLTGLANRALFQDRLHHAVSRIERTRHHLAVLYLDLDNLKVVNDTLGHSGGTPSCARWPTSSAVACAASTPSAASGRRRVRHPRRGDQAPGGGRRVGGPALAGDPPSAGGGRATSVRPPASASPSRCARADR